MNDALPVIQQSKKSKASLFWSLAAFGISVFALLRVGFVLRAFYLDTASLAAGTWIRPMGATLQAGITWTASILLGGLCASVGGIIALIQRRWRLTLFRVFGGRRDVDSDVCCQLRIWLYCCGSEVALGTLSAKF